MKVPEWPQYGERERELLEDVLRSGRWGGFHPFVSEFEARFAELARCRYAVTAMNGTVTLEALLEALDIGPGCEVIVPAISFFATASAVSRRGALPVFVDIDDTFNIDPECARQAVTGKTRAILAVHFGGPMADVEALAGIAAAATAFVIEDAAHAHGSEWAGRRAGGVGIAASFSFQNSKVITAGEGGVVTTSDEELAERVRSIVNQGRRSGGGWFEHYEMGSNLRMTAWQAAVLLAQLERLPEQNCARERNAQLLRRELEGTGIEFSRVPEAARVHTNYLFLGTVADRDRFVTELTTAGVPCTPFYPHTLYRNPVFAHAACRVMECPVAEARIKDAFWLPHRVLLGSEADVREVATIMRNACRVVATTSG